MESDTAASDQQATLNLFGSSENIALTSGTVVSPGAFLLSDLCFLFIAWALVITVPQQSLHIGGLIPRPSIIALWICLCSWFAAQGHYTSRNSFSSEAAQVAAGIFLAGFVEWSVQFDGVPGSWRDVGPWIAALLLVPIGRLALKRTLFQLGPWRLPTAVVGSKSQCDAVSEMLANDWYRGFVVRAEISGGDAGGATIKNELERLTNLGLVRYVLIVMEGADGDAVRTAARAVQWQNGISLGFVPPISGIPGRELAVDRFFGSELVVLREGSFASPRVRAVSKRCLDIAISVTLLLLALPIMLSIAWLIRRDGGPIFYASQRLGHGGKLFPALKFRTMAPDADRLLQDLLRRDPVARAEWEIGFKLRQDPRITGIGRILRELSLDELPQLINVLTGDMSLVGPRPLLPAERAAYGEAFQTYCQCIPGITGPWQVSGRNNLEYQQRIELNNWYANNSSFWIDMVILFRTLSVVVRRVGAV